MGAWHFLVLSAGNFWFFLLEIFGSFCWKTPMPIKFRLLGGGVWVFLEGGVGVPILFLWAWGFFRVILPCFHASLFPFCPLCWPPLSIPFSGHIFAIFFPSKIAQFCRAKGTAQSSTDFGKEIPSRNLREERSVSATWTSTFFMLRVCETYKVVASTTPTKSTLKWL